MDPSVTAILATSTQDGISLTSGIPGLPHLKQWSSIIGIITAICGNLLISFALNIQRYAHQRLRREHLSKVASLKNLRKRTTGLREYGTTEVNGNGKHSHDDATDGNENTISQAEPSVVQASRSYSSDRTITPEDTQTKPYTKSPYWWAGLVMMAVGEAGNFLAYGFAPASIVSPLGVVALVSNCIIAPVMLKEPFRQRDFWGVLTAIAGVVVVVLSAKQEEVKLGPNELWAAIARWEFLVYASISWSLIFVGMWASSRYGERTILIDLGLVALFGKNDVSQQS
jgi:hypothetical protein